MRPSRRADLSLVTCSVGSVRKKRSVSLAYPNHDRLPKMSEEKPLQLSVNAVFLAPTAAAAFLPYSSERTEVCRPPGVNVAVRLRLMAQLSDGSPMSEHAVQVAPAFDGVRAQFLCPLPYLVPAPLPDCLWPALLRSQLASEGERRREGVEDPAVTGQSSPSFLFVF